MASIFFVLNWLETSFSFALALFAWSIALIRSFRSLELLVLVASTLELAITTLSFIVR